MEIEWVGTPDHLKKDPKVLGLIETVVRKTDQSRGMVTVMCAEKSPTEFELSIWVKHSNPFTSVTAEYNILSEIRRECNRVNDCYTSIDASKELNTVYVAILQVPLSARSAAHSFQQHVAAINAVRTSEEDTRSRSPTKNIKQARKKYWEEGGHKEEPKPKTSTSILNAVGGVLRDTLFN